MQVGCGVYEARVNGRGYLYFWHYEERGGRRVQLKDYLGPALSPESRSEAVRRVDEYYRGAIRQLERSRRAALAGLRSRKA